MSNGIEIIVSAIAILLGILIIINLIKLVYGTYQILIRDNDNKDLIMFFEGILALFITVFLMIYDAL